MSRTRVEITDGPLRCEALGEPSREADDREGVGSRVRFEGVVRGLEGGERLEAIDYEAYEPMASRVLQAIADEEASRPGVRSIVVLHSRGRVAVGEISFACEVRSAHRAEGLAALASLIDRMKQDVPIWKRLVAIGPARSSSGDRRDAADEQLGGCDRQDCGQEKIERARRPLAASEEGSGKATEACGGCERQ